LIENKIYELDDLCAERDKLHQIIREWEEKAESIQVELNAEQGPPIQIISHIAELENAVRDIINQVEPTLSSPRPRPL